MIGLEIEINKRKPRQQSRAFEKLAIGNISNILGKFPASVTYTITHNRLTVEDALKIFRECIPQEQQTFDYFIYLFTEQGGEDE